MIAKSSTATVPDVLIDPATGVLDATGPSYPLALRVRPLRSRWWRPLVAIIGIVVSYLVLNVALSLAALAFDNATGLTGGLVISPALYLSMNLSLAALIPISLLLHRWLYGPAAGLHSVLGRIRWSLVRTALLIAVPVWVIMNLTTVLAGEPRLPSTPEIALLVIVLLTTPLQAAGEEYAFRGLLNRAFANLTGRFSRAGVILGMVVSSLAFCLAHNAFQPLMLLYFFTFGVVLAVAAWRTGGLEVPTVIHVVHNVTAFIAGMFMAGNGVDALASRGTMEPGAEIVFMTIFMVAVAAAVWVITAIRPVRRTAPEIV